VSSVSSYEDDIVRTKFDLGNININWEQLLKLYDYKTGCYKAEFNALCPSNSIICIFWLLNVLVNYDFSEIASKQQAKKTQLDI